MPNTVQPNKSEKGPLTITPDDFTLMVECWTYTLEAVSFAIATFVPSFLVYIHGTGTMKAVAKLRDITFSLGLATQIAFRSQLAMEENNLLVSI